jgi:hypothetical protein
MTALTVRGSTIDASVKGAGALDEAPVRIDIAIAVVVVHDRVPGDDDHEVSPRVQDLRALRT